MTISSFSYMLDCSYNFLLVPFPFQVYWTFRPSHSTNLDINSIHMFRRRSWRSLSAVFKRKFVEWEDLVETPKCLGTCTTYYFKSHYKSLTSFFYPFFLFLFVLNRWHILICYSKLYWIVSLIEVCTILNWYLFSNFMTVYCWI